MQQAAMANEVNFVEIEEKGILTRTGLRNLLHQLHQRTLNLPEPAQF